MFGQETKHAGISKKSYSTMANRKLLSSLSHRFYNEAFFRFNWPIETDTKSKAQNLIFSIPELLVKSNW